MNREPPPGLLTDAEPEADPVEVAKQIILRQLSHAPKTRHQLAEVLRRRLVPDAAASRALDRITELGYIDDEAFARAWVESRHRSKALSERLLRRELGQRGVAPETIDQVLAAGVDVDSERAAATGLVEKKLRSMARLDDQTKTRRLVSMLSRKGYSLSLARGVVLSVLEGDHRDAGGVEAQDLAIERQLGFQRTDV
ncbi:MAG TPA: regulatory protein RecX [Actinomycetes bacterium]|nr:regulatory protein RecX [Actinomycetes bacterium]